MENEEIVTNSADETFLFGEAVAREVSGGGIICLYGDLGSGKTTFTQGLAKGLGIEKHVNSPTFLIMRTYALATNNFYHIDLYRLASEEEIEDIGLTEILNDPTNIVVIEWSEKLRNLLPEKRIDIRFEYLDENKRRIKKDDYR